MEAFWKSQFNIGTSVVILLTFIYTALTFSIYIDRSLNQNLNNHILSSSMFGVPDVLAKHGLVPFYQTKADAGWDGQFYYYMSNDLKGGADTIKHIDTPAYRYQRIGLALYIATVAKLCGLQWVSPKTYFVLYFVLILLATFMGAQVFASGGISPYWILLWSLSVGTQLTLFNALPDAAADAFLIIAMSALWNRQLVLSLLPFTLAALSREVYLLFPACIFLALLFERALDRRLTLTELLKPTVFYLLLLPGLILTLWKGYLTYHFHNPPVDVFAVGLLGVPLKSWWMYFISGVTGHHLWVGAYAPYSEALCLFLFLMVLIFSVFLGVQAFRMSYTQKMKEPILLGCFFALCLLACLYFCFGNTVIKYYTGYLKVMGVFLFFLPLGMSAFHVEKKTKLLGYGLLLVSVAVTTYYHLTKRVLLYANSPFNQFTHRDAVSSNQQLACFKKYQARMVVTDMNTLQDRTLKSRLLHTYKWLLIKVEVTNTGAETWTSSNNLGSIFMSSQWVNARGEVVQDGLRSAFTHPVLPGQTVSMYVVSSLPNANGLSLKLSPIQEGCAWFYRANAAMTQPLILQTGVV